MQWFVFAWKTSRHKHGRAQSITDAAKRPRYIYGWSISVFNNPKKLLMFPATIGVCVEYKMCLHQWNISIDVEGKNRVICFGRKFTLQNLQCRVFSSELTFWCINIPPIDWRFCHLLCRQKLSTGLEFGWRELLAWVSQRCYDGFFFSWWLVLIDCILAISSIPTDACFDQCRLLLNDGLGSVVDALFSCNGGQLFTCRKPTKWCQKEEIFGIMGIWHLFTISLLKCGL